MREVPRNHRIIELLLSTLARQYSGVQDLVRYNLLFHILGVVLNDVYCNCIEVGGGAMQSYFMRGTQAPSYLLR